VVSGRAAETTPAPVTATPRGQRETILIVDDEPLVRRAVGRLLRDAGYEVVEAADGESALATYTRQGHVDLVLLDESMPGWPGHVVLDKIVTADPAARVVIFSGFQPNPALIKRAKGVLEKPVQTDELLAFVRRILDRP
jgi:DNA-binding NtrC family response regulator